ncbi:MAG: hypothetical protein F6K51_35595, partial [Moorea sp. SIO3I8]|nr:hypothetical protein [Moorena sp. SIO3I8]
TVDSGTTPSTPDWIRNLAGLSNYRDFDGIIYAIALWFSSGCIIS